MTLKMPRLIWADWAGLVVAAFIAISAMMMLIILTIAAGGIADARLYGDVANWTLAIEAVFAFPLWLVLRGFDYLSGGPARRAPHDAKSETKTEPSGLSEVTEPPAGPDQSAGEK